MGARRDGQAGPHPRNGTVHEHDNTHLRIGSNRNKIAARVEGDGADGLLVLHCGKQVSLKSRWAWCWCGNGSGQQNKLKARLKHQFSFDWLFPICRSDLPRRILAPLCARRRELVAAASCMEISDGRGTADFAAAGASCSEDAPRPWLDCCCVACRALCWRWPRGDPVPGPDCRIAAPGLSCSAAGCPCCAGSWTMAGAACALDPRLEGTSAGGSSLCRLYMCSSRDPPLRPSGGGLLGVLGVAPSLRRRCESACDTRTMTRDRSDVGSSE